MLEKLTRVNILEIYFLSFIYYLFFLYIYLFFLFHSLVPWEKWAKYLYFQWSLVGKCGCHLQLWRESRGCVTFCHQPWWINIPKDGVNSGACAQERDQEYSEV